MQPRGIHTPQRLRDCLSRSPFGLTCSLPVVDEERVDVPPFAQEPRTRGRGIRTTRKQGDRTLVPLDPGIIRSETQAAQEASSQMLERRKIA